MLRLVPRLLVFVSALLVLAGDAVAARAGRRAADVLRAVSAAPAHLVNSFSDDAQFAATRAGDYVVLDRRRHSVHVLGPDGRQARRIIEPGLEAGSIFDPIALALNEDDIIGVLDSPNGYDRVQYFSTSGLRVGGFYLPVRPEPRLTIRNVLVASGGTLGFSGSRFVLSRPEWGTLVTELDTFGRVVRQAGHPRPTGQGNADRDLELAMNVGIPLPEPGGGFYFVFQTGVPLFRKYAPDGRLLFERHIEGPELDARIQALPTTWPARPAGNRPVVPPLVRAAAVDRTGRLWVSLVEPYTYVYSPAGDKVRTVQFRGAGLLAPSSLFFTARGRLVVSPGGYEFAVD